MDQSREQLRDKSIKHGLSLDVPSHFGQEEDFTCSKTVAAFETLTEELDGQAKKVNDKRDSLRAENERMTPDSHSKRWQEAMHSLPGDVVLQILSPLLPLVRVIDGLKGLTPGQRPQLLSVTSSGGMDLLQKCLREAAAARDNEQEHRNDDEVNPATPHHSQFYRELSHEVDELSKQLQEAQMKSGRVAKDLARKVSVAEQVEREVRLLNDKVKASERKEAAWAKEKSTIQAALDQQKAKTLELEDASSQHAKPRNEQDGGGDTRDSFEDEPENERFVEIFKGLQKDIEGLQEDNDAYVHRLKDAETLLEKEKMEHEIKVATYGDLKRQHEDLVKSAAAQQIEAKAQNDKISKHEIMIKNLRNDISRHMLQRAERTAFVTQLEHYLRQSKGQNEEITEQLRTKTQRVEELEAEAKAVNASNTAALAEKDGYIRHLEEEAKVTGASNTATLEEKKDRIKQLEEEAKAANASKTAALTGKNSRIKQLEATLEEKSDRIKQLGGTLEEKSNRIKRLETTLEEKDDRTKQLEKEAENAATSLTEKARRIELLEEKAATLLVEKDGRIKQLEQEARGAATSLAEKDGRVKLLEKEAENASTSNAATLTGKDGRIEQLEKEAENAAILLAQKTRRPELLEKEAENAATLLAEKDGRIKKLEKEAENAATSLAEKTRRTEQLEKEAENAATSLAEKTRRIGELESEVNDAKARVGRRDDTIGRRNDTIRSQGYRIESMTSTIGAFNWAFFGTLDDVRPLAYALTKGNGETGTGPCSAKTVLGTWNPDGHDEDYPDLLPSATIVALLSRISAGNWRGNSFVALVRRLTQAMAGSADVNHELMKWIVEVCCVRVADLPDTERWPAKTALWAMADVLKARSGMDILAEHGQDAEYGMFEEAQRIVAEESMQAKQPWARPQDGDQQVYLILRREWPMALMLDDTRTTCWFVDRGCMTWPQGFVVVKGPTRTLELDARMVARDLRFQWSTRPRPRKT